MPRVWPKKPIEEERVHEAHDEVEVYVADPAPHVEAQGHEVGGHADDHPVCERTDGSCSPAGERDVRPGRDLARVLIIA